MPYPLEGIRVVDLGQIYAAPYCTLQLAYMGAEIIKVEPPGSGEMLRLRDYTPGGVNYSFLMLNANKKSLTLNLKHPRGRAIALKLLADADVLVENYADGVMESFGLGYDALADKFPRLIYASGKGYAPGSRYAKLGAMDPTVQAASGFIDITGFDRQPVKTPATFIDMGTGSHLVSGILAALFQRERTGRGQKVEVAMLDVAIPALTAMVSMVLQERRFHRMGNRHWGVCPSDVYPTSDGRGILIYCLTENHWRALARQLGNPEFLTASAYAGHAARLKAGAALDEAISAFTRVRTRDELVELLIESGVPCGPVRTVAEVVADPEVAARGMLVESDYPARGPIKVAGSPIKLSAAPQRPVARPPELGEHSAEVLATVGIDAAELEQLRKDGVV